MIEALMINSNPKNALKIEESLKPLGYHFTHEHNIETAKQLMAHINYDCTLIDCYCFFESTVANLNQTKKALSFFKENGKRVFFIIQDNKKDYIKLLNEIGADRVINIEDPRTDLSRVLHKTFIEDKNKLKTLYTVGPITANFEDYSLKIHNQRIYLTPIEFKILISLLKKPNMPISRDELHSDINKTLSLKHDSRRIDAHISNLRKKLGAFESILGSVYGKGYVLRQSFL